MMMMVMMMMMMDGDDGGGHDYDYAEVVMTAHVDDNCDGGDDGW